MALLVVEQGGLGVGPSQFDGADGQVVVDLFAGRRVAGFGLGAQQLVPGVGPVSPFEEVYAPPVLVVGRGFLRPDRGGQKYENQR